MSALTLRVFHPSIDPYEITAELGLPAQTLWAAGDGRESYWQTRLAGNERGHGDLNSALRDVAARFAHYRFFVNEIRGGGGQVEIAIDAAETTLDEDVVALFADLKIVLVFPPSP